MKQYGIRITLPREDSMRAAHLLGEDWEGHRWFDSAQERDRILERMERQPGYYRKGDTPTQLLSKVEREGG
ncbi:MAG: hypothetical protein ACR2RL_19165 [Gammaproteobacteria bacterium]